MGKLDRMISRDLIKKNPGKNAPDLCIPGKSSLSDFFDNLHVFFAEFPLGSHIGLQLHELGCAVITSDLRFAERRLRQLVDLMSALFSKRLQLVQLVVLASVM